jgi:hypothetical protein
MIHDGIKCRRSNTYGYRLALDGDVDLDGRPVKEWYVVIVRIDACPIVEKDGGRYYEPKDVPQAFPMDHGGTNYGYGRSRLVKHGAGRYVRVYRKSESGQLQGWWEWMREYVKTPYYVVKDGVVYVGACYREHDEIAKVRAMENFHLVEQNKAKFESESLNPLCPECGSAHTYDIKGEEFKPKPTDTTERDYHCNGCGHDWTA